MAKKAKKTKRERLVDAAAELFHQRGVLNTSLADVAKQSGIPVGNVYYYFKTKEELLLAAIEKRRQVLRLAYAALNSNFTDPRQRLTEALRFFDDIKGEYTKYGCPLGRLVIELGKDNAEAKKETNSVVDEFVSWAAAQFFALGHHEQARDYAISLMAGIEGAAIMAKAYGDKDIFAKEMQRLTNWVEALPNTNIPIGKFKIA